MTKIQNEQIEVQPKWHFMLGSFLMAFGMITTLVLSVYLVSISWYKANLHSTINYLWFGTEGLGAFWSTFPWLYLILAIVSLVVGIRVIQKYDFSYKMRWGWVLVGLVLGVFVAGIVVDGLGLNKHLSRHKLAKPMYIKYGEGQNWYKGEVSRVDVRRMTVTTMGTKQQVRVRWNDYTRLPFGGEFSAGEWVIMVGDWEGDDFVAEGIGEVGKP